MFMDEIDGKKSVELLVQPHLTSEPGRHHQRPLDLLCCCPLSRRRRLPMALMACQVGDCRYVLYYTYHNDVTTNTGITYCAEYLRPGWDSYLEIEEGPRFATR